MVSPARYRGVLGVTAGILAVMAAIDALLKIAVGPSPPMLYETVRLQPWDIDLAGGKVAGIAALRRGGDAAAGRPIGVIIGQSSSVASVDPRILDAESGLGLRWVSLDGVGGGFEKLSQIAELLTHLEPRPSVVVLAVSPLMLADAAAARDRESYEEATAALRRALQTGGPRAAMKPAWRLASVASAETWILRNRARVSMVTRDALYRARWAVARSSGLGIEAVFAPTPEPWKAALGYPPRSSWPAGRAEMLWEIWRYNWRVFEPATFSATGTQARLMAETVARIRASGAKLLVVLMPQSGYMRTHIPAEARSRFRAALDRACAPEAPALLDLEDVVPDDLFGDGVHPDYDGRKISSRLIARRLAKLRGGPPSAPGAPADPGAVPR